MQDRLPSQKSVHRILEERGTSPGRRVALAIREKGAWREVTYAELSLRVRSVSAYFVRRSIGGGDRIAILSESRPEWAAVFLGAVRNGATVVPLDPKLTVDELAAILDDCRPRMLFASDRCAGPAAEVAGRTAGLEVMAPLPSLEGPRDRPGTDEREPAFGDCAVIAYTSGTTGRPKGVRISYGSLAFQADVFEREFGIGRDDVFLSMLPLNHMFELTCGLLSVLNAGGQVAYCESLFPHELAAAARERGATRMLTVPLFLRALLRSPPPGEGGPFGSRFLALHCGGAPLEPRVAEAIEALGISVFEGYGLTETSPVIATNVPRRKRLGSVGLPLPGTEVRIARAPGEDDGEILVRGPHVMLGYYGMEELTREAIDADGWFHTGDLGRVDADGFLHVTGRLKSLIVLPSGKKVQPEEIEAVLAASPNVKEVCVVGRHAGKGEEVEAVAVPSEPLRSRVGEAHERLRSEIEIDFGERMKVLAAFKRPVRIHVVTRDLPKTTTGKVRRAEVVRILDAEGAPR